MRIYTKVGDGGNTFLIGGKKVRKDDPLIETLGTVDELSAAIGVARSFLKDEPIAETLAEAQKLLHILGADLAASEQAPKVPRISPLHIRWTEKEIDSAQIGLPPLTNFILPGGAPSGAALHLARAVCRRAERKIIPLLKKKKASKDAQIFLNRLSDFLFVLARAVNRSAGVQETIWNG